MIAQTGVHLVFFLHITAGPYSTNNVPALAFGVVIVMMAGLAVDYGEPQSQYDADGSHHADAAVIEH